MFTYTHAILQKLEISVSQDRLSTYLQLANGDLAGAVGLYVRNSALSESLYTPLQGVEVAIRNSMHERLRTSFGPDWYDQPAMQLQHIQSQKIAEAKTTLTREAKPLTSGRIVAELSLGFWVGILGRKYENYLWRPILRHAFPNAPRGLLRKDTHSALDRIRRLRNRVMHHEPILTRDLQGDHDLMLGVIGWICTDTRDWIAHHSRFTEVFTN